LCFGFSQIIKTLPLRLTILHLAQRFRIDGETFIQQFSLLTTILITTNSQGFNYTRSFIFRPEYADTALGHWTVRIRGSPSVTAIECSKCAVKDPSVDTTVHWSDNTFVSAVPTKTMGSMAIVIPALRGIPVPALP
jgi:hypothetical protein